MAVVLGLLLAFALSVWWEVRAGSESDGGGEARADTASGDEPARVEVLNGAGEPGIAERAAERLRGRGFDVVFYGNAENFDYESTRVLARSDRMGEIRRLADAMSLDSARRELRPELYLDATVILGSDWQGHMPSPAPDTVASGGSQDD